MIVNGGDGFWILRVVVDTQEWAAFQLCDWVNEWAPPGIFLRRGISFPRAARKFTYKVMFRTNFTESPRVFKIGYFFLVF